MIFSELYSAYYNTVAAILSRVIEGDLSERELQKIVSEKAFGESVLTVLPSLKSEKWQLLHPDMTTSLEHIPTMPLTNIQKQWLKAISLDSRIKLFDVRFEGLDDVEPLFTPDDYYVYDKYTDGDDFESEEYIKHFRIILDAIKEGGQIKFEMLNRKGNTVYVRCKPKRLEYSEKDDKFRLIASGCGFITTVNLSKITKCTHYTGEKEISDSRRESAHETLVLKILDERNALERVMLHFAHFEKSAEKLDEKNYLLKIKYNRDDETEIAIRVLSFGPMVEAVAPSSLRKIIIEKLKKQLKCGLK